MLWSCVSAQESPSPDVRFRIPRGCQLMTDAAVRLLSLFNQLDHATRRVVVDFEEDESGLLFEGGLDSGEGVEEAGNGAIDSDFADNRALGTGESRLF